MGRVVFPDGLAPARAVVRGPDGVESPLGADGVFEIAYRPDRNQVAEVVDAETEQVLLMGILPGDVEGLPAPVVQLSLQSTAEALLFLHPNVVHDDPIVFHAFTQVAAMGYGADEIAGQIESDWRDAGAWSSQGELLGNAIQNGADELTVLATETADELPVDGCAEGAEIPDFKPAVLGNNASGIEVELFEREPGVVDIQVNNVFTRRVDVYLEPALPNGGRGYHLTNDVEFRPLGAIFNYPEFFVLVAHGFSGNSPFFSPSSTCFTHVNLDPQQGGFRRWRLFAYGPGHLGERVPHHLADTPEMLLLRAVPPMVRTLVFDGILNLASVATTIDRKFLHKNLLALEGAAQAVSSALMTPNGLDKAVRYLKYGDAPEEFYGFIFSVAYSYLKDHAADLLSALLKNGGEAVATEAVSKFFPFIDAYNAAVAVYDLVALARQYSAAATVEMMTIVDAAGAVQPTANEGFPPASVGCPYRAKAKVIDGEGPFRWSFVGAQPEGLRIESADPDSRVVHLVADRFPARNRAFTLRVGVMDGNELAVVAEDEYIIQSFPARPQVNAVNFPAGGSVDPAGRLQVEVIASHCLGANRLVGGTVYAGDAFKEIDLNPRPIEPNAVTRRFTGTLTIKDVRRDRRSTGRLELARVEVRTAVTAARGHGRFEINNVAPEAAEGSKHVGLAPGDVFDPKITVTDKNADGGAVEVRAGNVGMRYVKALQLNGRGGPVRSDDVRFARKAARTKRGEIDFGTRDTVTIKLPHPDNDGTTPSPDDDAPLLLTPRVHDDQFEAARKTTPVSVVIRNRAPELTRAEVQPQVLPLRGTVQHRPLQVRVEVEDENGADDIGRVELNASAVGGPVAVNMRRVPGSKTATGATYMWSIADVQSSCVDDCVLTVQAYDRDDEVLNAGVSTQVALTVSELNLAPVLSGELAQYDDGTGPDPSGAPGAAEPRLPCPGQPIRFAVSAYDDNGNQLAADLLLDGQVLPMTPVVPGQRDGTFLLDVPAPAEGVHTYQYAIREIDTRLSGSTILSERHELRVRHCGPEVDRPSSPCQGEGTLLEVCDAVDNDCDGRTDEGFDPTCMPRLHSGEFHTQSVPVCPGDAVTYGVALVDEPGQARRVRLVLEAKGQQAMHALDRAGGRHGATIPAPSPGVYRVAFEVPGTAERLQLPHPLIVSADCDQPGPHAAIEIGTADLLALSGHRVVIGQNEGQSGSIIAHDLADETTLEWPTQAALVALSAQGPQVAWTEDGPRLQGVWMQRWGHPTGVGHERFEQYDVALTDRWLIYSEAGRGLFAQDLEAGGIQHISPAAEQPEAAFRPAVSGGRVAYLRDGQVRLYDLETQEDSLLDDGGEAITVALGARYAVWSRYVPVDDGYQLVVYDLDDGTIRVVRDELSHPPQPAVVDEQLVFVEATGVEPLQSRILAVRIDTGETAVISQEMRGMPEQVRASARYIAWIHERAAYAVPRAAPE